MMVDSMVYDEWMWLDDGACCEASFVCFCCQLLLYTNLSQVIHEVFMVAC